LVTLLIGNSFNALLTYGFNQMQVQRYMCVRSTRGAQIALFINIVGVAGLILLSCLMGVLLYAYYAGCDPYTAGRIKNVDQILPYFIMDTLGNKKGIPGLFLACAFSGSLSTISSGLNSMAAVIIEDIYKGLMRRKLTKEQQGFISKIFSVIIGVVIVLLTYFISYLGSVINTAISLSSTLCGPIMGVFFLGFFFPKANRLGALAGFFVSLALQVWIFIGVQLTKHQRSNHRLPLSIMNCTGINVSEVMKRNITTAAAISIN
jgi:sodium-coupled monocarboxylate transporter 8/12